MSERDNQPAWDGKPGHYEVWFLTMSDGRSAYWIRYTLLAPTGARAESRLWFARFDAERPERTLALNAPVPIEEYRAEGAGGGDRLDVRMGEATLSSGTARGAIAGGGHEVSWDLEFPVGGETHRLLPDALYRGGLAPTKPFSPNPHTAFDGTIVVDGDVRSIEAMPGQQGHLFGSRHAERWAWVHCGAFDGEEDTVLHGLSAQGKRGPITTPFTTFVAVRHGDRWLRFSKVSRRKDFALGEWRIDLGDRNHRLSGTVRADPERMVQARYLDPDGTPRWVNNSEISSSRFVLFERRRAGFDEVAVLSSEGTTHAEWAGRTPAPGEFAQHLAVETEAAG